MGAGGERELLRYYERLTRELLGHHWSEVECVATALLEHDLLSGTYFRDVVLRHEAMLKDEDRIDRGRWEAICNPEAEPESPTPF